MPSIELVKVHSLRSQCLIAEIRKLSDQQNELLQKAAFVGMTREEAKESDGRATRIAELVKELEMVTPVVGLSPKSQHEHEAEEAAWEA